MAARVLSLDAHQSVLDANRADLIGAALSAVLPLAGLVIVNAGAEAAGMAPVPSQGPLGLSGWVATGAMVVMLPMWGIARWLVVREGGTGRVAGWWIVALMLATLLVPTAIAGADAFFANIISMLVLLVGIIAAGRSAAVSASAAALLLPGLIWTGAGALIGFSMVAGGWSPPFALTQTKGH